MQPGRCPDGRQRTSQNRHMLQVFDLQEENAA